MPSFDRDVAIVGAGPSGLAAATALRKAGLSVAVLEARDRVGGRTWTKDIDGAILELGGQWVSPDQTALIGLLDELGLETFDRYREGQSVYVDPAGTATRYTGENFPVAESTVKEIDRLIEMLDKLAAEIGPEEPWAHPLARELDIVSFEGWLAQQSDDAEATANIGMFIAGGMLTKPAHAFSALQAILMAASAGSFTNLVDDGFILDKRVVRGMQQVSVSMAERLGEDVHLNAPVRTVRWSEDGVTVLADGDLQVTARKVIIAVPPNLYTRISYDPPLPRRQHQMHQHQSLGLVIKVHAVYDTPFWREEGLSGTGFGANQIAQEVYDNTNHEDSRGTLVAFVSDEKADAMFELSAEDRKRTILESIATYLGPKALEPVVYYESDWGTEEWTRGAYAASFDLGGLHRYGRDARTPVGPIHFSCSDIAAEGYQHVDGAVRMGHRTAEVISGLLER
ncbi:flavin monoamine oxidase family protein [Rhodococcus sp. MEB064]|uniref:flavin monoamine oxidase family protein n=1 Tax=Rhodococcus sp. MEB064 TaxID=1587522 RepID=UPI0005ABE243|nr:NAD(P)/FAD-dependent oxidoreductase [Rhodococcus sp. MEB064]KIQ15115.1 Putrescine oxidase [Rhodococcus sp. MEB064]